MLSLNVKIKRIFLFLLIFTLGVNVIYLNNPFYSNNIGQIRPFRFDLTNHTIPPILHYIYKDELAPEQYEPMIRRCLQINSDMTPILWTDKDALMFIKDHFPESFALYKQYSLALQQSDALRYFILYHFGGVYLDMDVYCERSFTRGLDMMGQSCILDQQRNEISQIWHNEDYLAMNSVMACRARHPFFRFVFSKLSKFVNAGVEVHSTGPMFLTKALTEWRGLESNFTKVTLAHPEVFSPNFPVRLFDNLRSKCTNYETASNKSLLWKGCRNFHAANWTENVKVFVNNRTLARHLFLNLGYSWNQHSVTKRFNLMSTFSSFKRYWNREMDNLQN